MAKTPGPTANINPKKRRKRNDKVRAASVCLRPTISLALC